MTVAQQLGGSLQVALADQLADMGRGDRDAASDHLVHHVHPHAVEAAPAAEPGGAALASVAEGEVVAADHMLGPQGPNQVVVHKGLPGHLHHGLVKMRHQDLVQAEAGLHQPLAVLDGINQRHRLVKDQGVGVGVKGQGRGPEAHGVGPLPGQSQQRGVAQMDAVKKSQGDDAVLCHGLFTSKKLLMVFSLPRSTRPRAAKPPSGP